MRNVMENASDCRVKEDMKSVSSGALQSEAAGILSSKPDRSDGNHKSNDPGAQYMDMLSRTLDQQQKHALIRQRSFNHSDRSPKPLGSQWSADTVALENKLTRDIAGLSDSEKEQFTDHMNTFLYRASKPTPDGKSRMDESEVAGTLMNCDKLLNPDANGLFLDGLFGKDKGQELRTMLAEQIMGEAAYPSKTDQGHFGTCGLASMETRTWFDKPSVAAKMIADEALTGQWTAQDGNVVKLPQKDFTPDKYSKDLVPKDGERNYAGQIFQATAFSDWGTRQSTPEYYATDGIVKKERDDGTLHDEGVNYCSDADGNKIEAWHGINEGPESEELARLDGPNTEVLTSDPRMVESGSNVVLFKGKEDLENKLQEAQDTGKMPVIITVSGYDQFFHQKSDQPGWTPPIDPNTNEPDHNINHYISIDKYDSANKTVVVDNQWGSHCDWGTTSVLGSDKDVHSVASMDEFFPGTQGQDGAGYSPRL